MDSSDQNTNSNHSTKRNLTNEQRQIIFETLLRQSKDGKLKRGSITSIATSNLVTTKTVQRIWRRGKACSDVGLTINVASRMPKVVGRKRAQIDKNDIIKIHFSRRTNIRSLANDLGIAKSILHRRIKEGLLKSHTNSIKPFLSEEGKRKRLCFCLSMLESSSLHTSPIFKGLYNYVHIDEKWFYLTKISERYYLLPEEEEPNRTCQSKNFITKVMFMVAVARPRFDANGNEIFSGKLGIFPFTVKEPAKRKSKNREAGTLETKSIIVTKDVTRACMIEKVLPAIRAKWPRSDIEAPIYIQQDNARPHIHSSDPLFLEAAKKDGFDIRISNQPPNSPDMNVLDLGVFNSIQSLQHREAPANIDELVNAVEKSFDAITSENLNRVFLSLQACMIEVMKVNGGIHYKLPHIGKGHLSRTGNLPISLECERRIVEYALAYLQPEQT